MDTGWALDGGLWYHAAGSGALDSGWLSYSGGWYWFDPSTRAMATGWVSAGGSSYYLDASAGGRMATGWLLDSGSWYWLEPSGARLESGWLSQGGSWYWIDPATHAMATGVFSDGSADYAASPSGAMQTGWAQVGGSWYHAAGSGALDSGWLSYSGDWYWLDPSTHAMATGQVEVGGAEYWAGPSGALASDCWAPCPGGMGWYASPSCALAYSAGSSESGAPVILDADGLPAPGWVEVCGRWFLAGEDGALLTGWQLQDGSWYYLRPSTYSAETGWASINGSWYHFASSCAMDTGRLSDGDSWYWLGESGAMAQSGWTWVGNVEYKFSSSGRMVGAWMSTTCFNQYAAGLPNGCESVAMSNYLNSMGYGASARTIWDGYLSFGSTNFVTQFAMGGCMAPAIVNAANRYLAGTGHWAEDCSGISASSVYSNLASGYRVQMWGTLYDGDLGYLMASQWYNGKNYTFYSCNHSVLVHGYDEERGIVYVADSISGDVERDASSFFWHYYATGGQAVIIR